MKMLNFLSLLALIFGTALVHAQQYELAVRGASLSQTNCPAPLPGVKVMPINPVEPVQPLELAEYADNYNQPNVCSLPYVVTTGCHNSQRISSTNIQSIYRLRFQTSSAPTYQFYDASQYCTIVTTDWVNLPLKRAEGIVSSSPGQTQPNVYYDGTSCLNSGNLMRVTTKIVCGGTAFQNLLNIHRNQTLTVNVIHYLTKPFLPPPVQLMGGW